jgi:hypothetical protein
MRANPSSSNPIASTMCGPVFDITHSARLAHAASVSSARVGTPTLASDSATCVGQIGGVWAASHSHRFSSWTLGRALEADLDRQVAPSEHDRRRSTAQAEQQQMRGRRARRGVLDPRPDREVRVTERIECRAQFDGVSTLRATRNVMRSATTTISAGRVRRTITSSSRSRTSTTARWIARRRSAPDLRR